MINRSLKPCGEIVTDSAYNIFYRHRDWHAANRKLEKIDFDVLAQKPDMQYLQDVVEKQREDEAKKAQEEERKRGAHSH